ncbi:uncharacterized protein LOC116767343 [Danaus plexippus]|uniref:Uncharacterized protein n=1 Tax=Danaus plexippus plexippus TaxID=278856 RepID=A0A212F8Q7_DANPL|nr:uncharacterized protein LOC116767343 [Danaus plexippus]OWR50111.1 hypothetical protein KGM_212446 [Danaus plexippus plexippus]
MNRDFVYDHQGRPTAWSRAGSTLNRWLWGALCCGVPGIPCYFCTCCEKLDDTERDRPRVNQSTATGERMTRPHRPHAPRGRKSTPEMLSAVRCALSQLQGEPAPPLPATLSASHSSEPG